jgi:cation diffusion facilitator family transporter
MTHQNRKRRVALLSVISNATLVLFKLIIGLLIGSVSVLSEAVHSGVDLVAALISMFAVRVSGQPADQKHTYGHGKFENLSAGIEGLLIFLAAGWIIYEAVLKLMHPKPVETAYWGILIMTISAGANLFVSHKLFKTGRATDSPALMADGWHLRTDVWTSGGVAIGLVAYTLGRSFLPGAELDWIDPVIALVVATLIIKAAWDLTYESVLALLDVSLPAEEEKAITEVIVSMHPKVLSYHELKTRKSGAERFVEFHIVVPKELTVEAANQICEETSESIRTKLTNSVVTIHADPCMQKCDKFCRGKCAFAEIAN